MALRKRINKIDKNEIRAGQVLEIQYVDKKGKSSTDLILTVDPAATTVATTGAGPKGIGQGRVGTLHAIKLKDLPDLQLLKLIAEVRGIKNQGSQVIRALYENSVYSQGLRNYRTYLHDGIKRVSRVTLGQPASRTHKEKIGDSVLYGCIHGTHVELLEQDYTDFLQELKNVNGQIYYEGEQPPPAGDWPIIRELLTVTDSPYTGTQPPAFSWEPTKEEFAQLVEQYKKDSVLADLGGKLAGWWGQWINGDLDGGTSAIKNLLGAWGSDRSLTIGEAFKNSGISWADIESKWQVYTYEGRTYTTDYMNTLLDKQGWMGNSPTTALKEFNEAGHFQLFPSDNKWIRPPAGKKGTFSDNKEGRTAEKGKLFPAQSIFNEIRDRNLINKMKTNKGIYFGGTGHVDNLRKLPR